MFDVNLTLVIFVGMFLGFMWLLNEMVLKPVGKVLEQRKAIIRDNIEAASSARARANEVVTQYQARIHAANAEAQALITETTTSAEKARAAELKKVQDKGQAEIQAAREKLSGERGVLIDELVDQERLLVESITRKLIGDNASVSLDSGTIKRALEEAR